MYYVCGLDHYQNCGLSRGLRNGAGVVVLPRDGKTASVPTTGRSAGSSEARIIAVHPDLCGGALQRYSSTKLREALREGNRDIVASYLPQQVSAKQGLNRA